MSTYHDKFIGNCELNIQRDFEKSVKLNKFKRMNILLRNKDIYFYCKKDGFPDYNAVQDAIRLNHIEVLEILLKDSRSNFFFDIPDFIDNLNVRKNTLTNIAILKNKRLKSEGITNHLILMFAYNYGETEALQKLWSNIKLRKALQNYNPEYYQNIFQNSILKAKMDGF